VQTKEDRFTVCIHEAAHAVILSLGGLKVEVASECVSEWTTTGINGDCIDVFGGICISRNTLLVSRLVQWNDEKKMFIPDTNQFYEIMLKVGKYEVAEHRRMIRAYIVGTLAGIFAKVEFGKGESKIDSPIHDVEIAKAMSSFLPHRDELEELAKETKRVLREPDIWEKILTLARSLELLGVIEARELFSYLPEKRKNWPRFKKGYKPESATDLLK